MTINKALDAWFRSNFQLMHVTDKNRIWRVTRRKNINKVYSARKDWYELY